MKIQNWAVNQTVTMKTKLAMLTVLICTGLSTARAQNASPSARTVPLWNSSFTYRGTTFPLITVGTNPANGSATTVIPTVIIPLRLIFADGNVLDVTTSLPGQSSIVDLTVNSPIFQSTTYTTQAGTTVGVTQYGDAMQRAQFWNFVSTTAPDYHVLLSQPTVLPVQEIQVPSHLGHTVVGSVSGKLIGFIDFQWFAYQTVNLMEKLHLDPTSLPFFLEHNTFFYFQKPSNCCALAFFFWQNDFKANGNQPVQTFITPPYTDPGILDDIFPGTFFGNEIQDIYLLSKELTRWINDPYSVNTVPPYLVSQSPSICQTALRVSDPSDKEFDVTMNGFTYHLSDVAFLPWFEQVSPSPSVDGYYSFLNNLPTLSPCP